MNTQNMGRWPRVGPASNAEAAERFDRAASLAAARKDYLVASVWRRLAQAERRALRRGQG